PRPPEYPPSPYTTPYRSFEVGVRNGLKPINILTPQARINGYAPKQYRGLDRFEAREKIVADLDALGALVWVEDKKIMVPYDEKTDRKSTRLNSSHVKISY